ncbi:ComEA family DNA-binding protein [Streptomyces justiciae]|uniref:ComEA family DNA-binding protein n=1 Tax=Streptomyces justiciae TaxID=2780140 RepID=A0ABU3LT55_9ACTN|nr:ComEA family DNA-binding protein [Streptomyces justiciae]MDT7842409.1 ComEA family DNA-binding protein [Streptomyces justiciae]
MALRSRSRTATPTSGPGRGPASDVRNRHRRRPATRGGTRQRYASAEELRRRAEVIFAERAGERRESGVGSPGRDGSGAPGASESWEDRPSESQTWVDPTPASASTSSGSDSAAGDWRGRVGPALRERMPVWLQARCGLERRSVVALTVLLVVAAGFAVQHFWSGRTQSVRAPEVVRAAVPFEEGREEAGPGAASGAPSVAGTATGTATAEIVVDVSGKVREPGIHRLPAGSRVADALRAAGGVRPGTDTAGLNRARFLVDGEQVVVGIPAGAAGAAGGSAGAVGGSAGSGGSVPGAGPAAPVSLNTATVDQLDTLPGVGPVLAQHIVDYRTQHGGFRSVDELREVNGIGERRFADLRNLVRP